MLETQTTPLSPAGTRQLHGPGCHASSSSKLPNSKLTSSKLTSSKLRLAIGAVTLLLAGGTLLAILLPHILTLLAAWCVVEVLFWIFVMRHNAQRLNAQPAGGHRPASADENGPVVFKRFIKVSCALLQQQASSLH